MIDISSKLVVIIKVYDRVTHLENCIKSLERCNGSNNIHVIVGSDANATKSHEERVKAVRTYLHEKEFSHRFYKLSVVYHEKNVGEQENSLACHSLAKSYGHEAFILMEDDIVVGRYFLKFMQDALLAYADQPEIIAVNGYLAHDLKRTPRSVFLYNRFCAYGYGSWYKKWDIVQKNRDSINFGAKIMDDFKKFCEISRFTTNVRSFPFLAERFYRAGDLEIGLMMEYEKLCTVTPPVSLTANKGLDGSGLRSGKNLVLQSREPFHDKLVLPRLETLERFGFEDLKNKISRKSRFVNILVFFIYRYVPFGFSILIKLRAFKKSI